MNALLVHPTSPATFWSFRYAMQSGCRELLRRLVSPEHCCRRIQAALHRALFLPLAITLASSGHYYRRGCQAHIC